jgi:uncharacterized membrane protein
MSTALFWWGLLWWSAGGVSEIARMWPRQALAVTLIVLTLTTQACGEIHRRGSVERIVSFLGVGLLMLGIGYILPLAPAATRANPP